MSTTPANRDFEDQRKSLIRHTTSIHQALKTLSYDEHPSDRPNWITGLKKPLAHAQLTPLQNHEVFNRMYAEEIERLQALRRELPGGQEDGEWHYSHFGKTVSVRKRTRANGQTKYTKVFARGVWKYVVNSETIKQRLDEWPRDVWGEPLGWMVRLDANDSEWDIEREDDDDDEDKGETKLRSAKSAPIQDEDENEYGEGIDDESDENEVDEYVPSGVSRRRKR